MDFQASDRQPPGMPNLQTNANMSGEFVMRVGIPHTSGKLAFHAFNHGYAAMVTVGNDALEQLFESRGFSPETAAPTGTA
ncbi:hypothetical protein P3T43_006999 [Paraburkholderia sp. GAS41]|jgi:hypothetical protein